MKQSTQSRAQGPRNGIDVAQEAIKRERTRPDQVRQILDGLRRYTIHLDQERQRTNDRAITDFVDWRSPEPRLALNRTAVLRYRIHLEQKLYAPATINIRLAAVRRGR